MKSLALLRQIAWRDDLRVVRSELPRFGRALLAGAVGLFSVAVSSAAPRPWQQVSMPSAADVAAMFAQPSSVYGPTVTWGWDGPMSHEAIARDLDALQARGLRCVTIEAGYGMDNAPYLSPAWFDMVKVAVQEAKARDMRVIIIDEGKYPSGFAGGKFSQERPDLRMQGVDVATKIPVSAGQSVEQKVAANVVGVLAVNPADGATQMVALSGDTVRWTAPATGTWELWIVDHDFRTPDTRAVNNATRAKDKANSMGDLINPEAVHQFIGWTHDVYARSLGDELGDTVIGFRGDEPDYGNTPWTDGILDTFQRRKGYDVGPYLAAFVNTGRNQAPLQLSPAQRAARADYWDVWSQLFADSFFKLQAEWCERHGVEHTTHLNNEHNMRAHVRSTGDFFRAMRHVQIPGVDSIWNQVWPGKVADFVKLAPSAAHLYGRPRALSESYAAYNPHPTVAQAEWGVNYQLVRGINLFEFMFFPSSASDGEVSRRGYMGEPGFRALADYTNRASFLMAQGRPAADIGVYFPSLSYWLQEWSADEALWKIAAQLHDHQRDFDFVDEQALTSVLRLEHGKLKNLSGQGYRAIIVPPVAAISRAALARLQAFAQAGGRVIVLGAPPAMVVDQSFRDATGPADVSWAVLEPAGDVTAAVRTALPPPDVAFDEAVPAVKYLHRQLADADVYFFFNESDASLSTRATLRGRGQVEVWDAKTGAIRILTGIAAAEGIVHLPLALDAGEARIVVITRVAPAVAFDR